MVKERRKREEVLNVMLAMYLRDKGVVSVPESILRTGAGVRYPDVLIEHHGLRIVIEGKVGDSPIAQVEAWNDAQKRLRNGVYDAALAVVYPPELRSSAYDRLLQQRH